MSLRTRLLILALRLTVKPALRFAKSPRLARKTFSFFAKVLFPFPRDINQSDFPLTAETGLDTAQRFSVSSKPTECCILYFHGGGYIAGSPNTHRGLLANLAKVSGYDVIAPVYPLAPKNPAPAQFDQALNCWNGLIKRGYSPSNIMLAGDSAGGGLALALLSAVCRQGETPAGLFAFSPWTDLTGASATHQTNRRADPIFPAGRLGNLADMVRGDLQKNDARISPLFADFPHCPNVMLFAGSTEILLDDTMRMAQQLMDHGASVQTIVEPNLSHVWCLFHGWIQEADFTIQTAADFTRQAFANDGRDDS